MPLQTGWLRALTSLKSHPFPASLATLAQIGVVEVEDRREDVGFLPTGLHDELSPAPNGHRMHTDTLGHLATAERAWLKHVYGDRNKLVPALRSRQWGASGSRVGPEARHASPSLQAGPRSAPSVRRVRLAVRTGRTSYVHTLDRGDRGALV